jgi:nicotinamide riboside kinase
MLVVNLLGEPGAGKSVTSAGLFFELSINGFKAELIHEVAKGYAWETPKDKNGNAMSHPIFEQQILLLGEQNRLLERVRGKRDIVITDSPLILPILYQPSNYLKGFDDITIEQFNRYNNFNILLERNHTFDGDGRVHDEEQSKTVKNSLKSLLAKHNIPYITLKTHANIHKEIMNIIQKEFCDGTKLKEMYTN